MIRQNFVKVISSQKFYKRALVLSYLAFFFMLLLLPFLPFMGEQGFISENAISAHNPLPSYDAKRTYRIHESMQQIKNYNSLSFIENFFLKNNVEPQKQEFQGEKPNQKGINLIGIYRTKRGEPGECNIFTFRHTQGGNEAEGRMEIALALSFLEMFIEYEKINYNARDIIFLAYDGRYKSYGKAMQEFLNAYYSENTADFERCGLLRQAINIEVDHEDVNKIALLHQGINSRVPDLDYYVLWTKLLDREAANLWDPEMNSFYERRLSNLIQKHYYPHTSQYVRDYLGFKVAAGDATIALNSIKGSLLGWPHETHSYQLEKGIVAMTVKAYNCTTCRTVKSSEQVLNGMGKAIEGANRASMSLQEQYHAGATVWIANGKKQVYFLLNTIALVGPMLLPIVVRCLIAFYEKKHERNSLRVCVEHAGLAISLLVIYQLPNILQFVWRRLGGEGFSLCSGSSSGGQFNQENFVLAFLAAATVLLLSGVFVFPRLVALLFPGRPIPEYTAQNWNTKYALSGAYMVISLLAWTLGDAVFAIVGTALLVPFFLFPNPIRPFSVKGFLGNVLTIAWGFVVCVGILDMMAFHKMTGLDLVKDVLTRELCGGSNLYKFLVFSVTPAIVHVLQIFTFSSKVIVLKKKSQ